MTMVTITAKDGGTFNAYRATPASADGTAPVIIVIQEIFGVNNDVRKKCDDWAAKGYVALAPDLFWRQEPNVQLNTLDQAELARAFGFLKGFNVDLGVSDIISTVDYARALPDTSGKVGTVGYCLGGRLAYLMGARSDTDVNIGYYGVTLESYLSEAANIKRPLMLHIAEEDKFVSKDVQTQIKAALSNNPLVTLHSYAGVDHAFSRLNGDHYNAEAATLANARTAEFFEKHLKNKAAAAA